MIHRSGRTESVLCILYVGPTGTTTNLHVVLAVAVLLDIAFDLGLAVAVGICAFWQPVPSNDDDDNEE